MVISRAEIREQGSGKLFPALARTPVKMFGLAEIFLPPPHSLAIYFQTRDRPLFGCDAFVETLRAFTRVRRE